MNQKHSDNTLVGALIVAAVVGILIGAFSTYVSPASKMQIETETEISKHQALPLPEKNAGEIDKKAETATPEKTVRAEMYVGDFELPLEKATRVQLEMFTNAERRARGLPEYTGVPLLRLAAQNRANYMAATGDFAHVAKDGSKESKWLDGVGYEYTYAGENLARGFFYAVDVQEAWMKSETHKANILDTDFTEFGVGSATAADGTIYIVQLFAAPVR